MPQTKRSRARVLALQALCALEAAGPDFERELGEFLQDRTNYVELGWRGGLSKETLEFARQLALGTWQHRERLDELVQKSSGWPRERIQPVERNILRLGLYELLECPQTPYQVVLNEAVELAHLFGGPESPAFINGVLDGLRRQLLPEA
jgi:N utilization substance protein B